MQTMFGVAYSGTGVMAVSGIAVYQFPQEPLANHIQNHQFCAVITGVLQHKNNVLQSILKTYCNLSCLLPWQVRGVSDDSKNVLQSILKKTYCNLSCLLPWQVRGVSDDSPTGADRIDWALN